MTEEGRRFFARRGIDVDALAQGRRALCRCCLDWSERRYHLGGTLGAAILDQIVAQGWAVREAKIPDRAVFARPASASSRPGGPASRGPCRTAPAPCDRRRPAARAIFR